MFLGLSLSLQNSKARDSFDAKRARFSSRLFRRVRASFEERRQTKVFLSLKLHSLKEKPPDFSLNRYTFLSQRDDDFEEARLRVFFKNARKRRTRRRRRFRLRKQQRRRRCEEEKEEEKKKRKRRRVGVERYRRWNEEERRRRVLLSSSFFGF